jgi:hypothetical protein
MRVRWAGYVALMGKKRNAYGLMIGRTLGRPRYRWMDNIKIDLVEMV